MSAPSRGRGRGRGRGAAPSIPPSATNDNKDDDGSGGDDEHGNNETDSIPIDPVLLPPPATKAANGLGTQKGVGRGSASGSGRGNVNASGSGSKTSGTNPNPLGPANRLLGTIPPTSGGMGALGGGRGRGMSMGSFGMSMGNRGGAASGSSGAGGGSGSGLGSTRMGTTKMTFVPKMVGGFRNKKNVGGVVKMEEDADNDGLGGGDFGGPSSIKQEDGGNGSFRGGRGRGRGGDNGRGRGRGRGRGEEVALTASGPMAMGPGERMGGRSGFRGAVGISRGGGAFGSGPPDTGFASTQFQDVDAAYASDYSAYSDEDEDVGMTGRGGTRRDKVVDLAEIGMEDEMAPMTLPIDPEGRREMERRRDERKKQAEKKKKALDIKPLKGQAARTLKEEPEDPGTPSFVSSKTVTPAPMAIDDSKEGTAEIEETTKSGPGELGLDQEEEKKVKIEMEKEDLAGDFVMDDSSPERLYVFQFPRKFPQFVNPLSRETSDPTARPSDARIKKEDPDGPADPKGGGPFGFGYGAALGGSGPGSGGGATGWMQKGEVVGCRESGKIGELEVRRSGKIRMKLGDVGYDVLSAAVPSFLQEIAIIDPPSSVLPSPSNPEPSLASGSAPPPDRRRAMYILGQTNKKFICAPDLSDLLHKWEEWETEEKVRAKKKMEEERRLKAEKEKHAASSAAANRAKAAAATTAKATGAARGKAKAPAVAPAKGSSTKPAAGTTTASKPAASTTKTTTGASTKASAKPAAATSTTTRPSTPAGTSRPATPPAKATSSKPAPTKPAGGSSKG